MVTIATALVKIWLVGWLLQKLRFSATGLRLVYASGVGVVAVSALELANS